MVRRPIAWLFWAAMAFALIMALLPHPPLLPGEPDDKVQHIAAFTVLALLGRYAYPRLSFAAILAGLSAFGAAIELLQSIPSLHRDSDVLDWIADTIAVAAMLLLIAMVRYMTSQDREN